MELTDLVPTERHLMRTALSHFFLLGGALLFAKSMLPHVLPHERPTVEVVVPSSARDADLSLKVDEAILVEEGLRFGWAETDPVIRRRLALNMAFANGATVPESDATIDDAAVVEALALGMHRSDPVVRGRLATRVRAILATPAEDELPDDATLLAHLTEHRSRFERASRVHFVHLMLPTGSPSPALDAEALVERLERGELTFDSAAALGHSNPLLPSLQRASVDAIDRLFGRGFGTAIAALEPGRWSGPFASAYGMHLVRVDRREEARLPSLESVRARVLADYLDETSHARVARRLAELRERYEVRVVRGEGTS
ncbi:MAG: peptidyl-prolyl cis-trans isomerase [Polyangiaceae bacterium]|nr:peptidyl-prolyl cis-trans isomerase [Polyangiaceae bacterium]